MAKVSALKGGKPGPHGCVTPATVSAQLARRPLGPVVLLLGTGAVSTQTKVTGRAPFACKVLEIVYAGQAAVTGTTITAETFARTVAGAAGATLQSAATDVKFASAAAALTGVTASLTATTANLTLAKGQTLETVITATSITAGPGDVCVLVTVVPTEDVANASGQVTTGADL